MKEPRREPTKRERIKDLELRVNALEEKLERILTPKELTVQPPGYSYTTHGNKQDGDLRRVGKPTTWLDDTVAAFEREEEENK